MTKVITYVLMLLFVVLFSLGFVITPWLSIISFLPLLAAVAFIIYKRHVEK